MEQNTQNSGGYGKKSWTKYLLIYIVVGGLLYGLIYYFFINKNGGYNYSNNPSTQENSGAVQVNPDADKTLHIAINNFNFTPVTLTVRKGTTIIWTNDDSAPHIVASDGGFFTSANLNKGDSYSYTFPVAGSFLYHCSIHPSMHGEIKVID